MFWSRELCGKLFSSLLKASFSFHNITPKNTQMTNLCTNLSLYITVTMIYYIRQEILCKSFSSLLNPYMSPSVYYVGLVISGEIFLKEILKKAAHKS